MNYIHPTAVTSVSDSFKDHQERSSPNPGTDYMAVWGSDVRAVASGVVTDVTSTFSGSGGRMVHIDHDDGTSADYLHLSSISVREGQRVNQGEVIGESGASGDGKEFYYGPHLHISFRTRHGAAYTKAGNIDFDALMRSQTTTASNGAHTIQEEDDMAQLYTLTSPPAPSTSIYFVHPGGVSPVKSVDPEVIVLKSFAEQMNSGKAPVLTDGQYKLVDEVMQRRL